VLTRQDEEDGMVAIMPDTLQQIVASGGGVIINASGRAPDQLLELAGTAASSGAMLLIRNAGTLTPKTLELIASVGRERVILELE
jgi:hypothetical protein